MATLQSQQPGRWAKYNANPDNFRRRQAVRDAARIAGPAPAYPPDAPLHGDWLGGRINGHVVVMRLMRDPRHRCDQWAAEIDGRVVADAAGLTALWGLLRKRFPKALSLRAQATSLPDPEALRGLEDAVEEV